VSGVLREGFKHVRTPAAIARAILWTAKFRGKLKGLIPAINPFGNHWAMPFFPSP